MQVERTVRPLLVVMPHIDVEDAIELGTAEDQQPVEALPSCATDPALDVRVRVWSTDRRPDGLHPVAVEDGVEGAAELRVTVVIKNCGRWPRSSRSISRLRACWTIQAPSGLLVQAMYSIRRLPMQMKTST